MNYIHLIAAILIGFSFTLLFSLGLKNKGSWGTLWFTFFILALASLAGQLWIHPAGPKIFGVSIFPSVFIAALIAFTLATVSFTSLPIEKNEAKESKTKILPEAFGIFFWLLLLLLLVAVGVGYYRMP